jgi:2-polyprenyl-6-methoxyphenol hydroxylase-like FAD-dependent oxidoreductase
LRPSERSRKPPRRRNSGSWIRSIDWEVELAEKRAVVIGGGIAGMCAARALSEFYDRVIVIERDKYPEGIGERRGVPQSRMFHTLIERGRREVEALFPGFHRLLDERGAPRVSFGFNAALMSPRGWSRSLPFPSLRGVFTSRGLLESTIRDLFRETPNVEVLEETEVIRLIASPGDHGPVCHGVEVRPRAGGEAGRIDGELIIDASGGQSRSSGWLEELGLAPPDEEVLDPLLTYAGQWLKMREGAKWPPQWWWTHGVFIQRVPPHDHYGAHLMRQENDLWLLTLVAGSGEDPPLDPEGVAQFLARLRSPLISQMLPLFEPVSKMTGYRLAKNRWRHYERWKESLSGFIAIGDATCVFNPNQGQGMSAAATEAGILRKCLARTTAPDQLPKLFFTEQSRFQLNPWRLAVCNDLRFSSVKGKRTSAVRAFNWYREQLALSSDRYVLQQLGEVDLLLKPVASIFTPLVAARGLISRVLPRWWTRPRKAERFAPLPPGLAASRSSLSAAPRVLLSHALAASSAAIAHLRSTRRADVLESTR